MKCIIHHGVFESASSLLSKNERPNSYSIQSLSSVIESIVLYDEVVVYDYRPRFDFHETHLDVISHNSFGKLLRKEGILETCNPYLKLFSDEDLKQVYGNTYGKSDTSYELNDGTVGATSILLNPSFMDFSSDPMVKSIDYNLASAALSKVATDNFLFSIKDKQDFLCKYTINILWQIEMGKIVKQQIGADGLIISPEWAPFWVNEKFQYASALQSKYNEYTSIISQSKFKNEYSTDFSPLTIIALDTSLNREMFAENLLLMRKDYSELREIGKKYRDLLNTADTYSEIEAITEEWSSKWDLVLKKIKKTDVPLRKRLFGWDTLKSLSLKRIGSQVVYEVFSEMSANSRINSLSIINQIDKEFMAARLADKRIVDLFGSIEPFKI